ncbi:hypothetical protein [Pedobacter cryophilus]|uniref:Uncharacterized protein n=1 Tax=Pedobacter cryophilus TaxID=2571271 RepID=A0A4U1C0R4_9SPHI|nr:hypothetical protein [Pedobacter cryophilus]TKB97660.1 hypothetical protein FA046_09840 [Pedobacter cryophilus]
MNTTLIKPFTQILPDFGEQNQKWNYDLIFVENETRFINRLLQKVMLISPLDDASKKIKDINSRISKLDEIINELKKIIAHTQDYAQKKSQQSTQEQLNHIEKLFADDKKIKRELYAIVDELVVENKHNNLTKSN